METSGDTTPTGDLDEAESNLSSDGKDDAFWAAIGLGAIVFLLLLLVIFGVIVFRRIFGHNAKERESRTASMDVLYSNAIVPRGEEGQDLGLPEPSPRGLLSKMGSSLKRLASKPDNVGETCGSAKSCESSENLGAGLSVIAQNGQTPHSLGPGALQRGASEDKFHSSTRSSSSARTSSTAATPTALQMGQRGALKDQVVEVHRGLRHEVI